MKYTTAALTATLKSGSAMITIFNGAGSGRIIKIWKVWFQNNQTTAVTGVVDLIAFRRIRASSGGASCTVIKHDSLNDTLPPQIVVTFGAKDIAVGILKKRAWSSDEAIAGTSTWDEWETVPMLNVIYEVNPNQSVIQPLTLREGEGMDLIQDTTTSTVGNLDIFVEFTME